MSMFGGFSASKLKPQLKMAIHRFTISSNKKAALMKQQKREISKLLDESPPKEEKARIKAESLIRDDNTIEAFEIMQLECELLSERIKLLSSTKECPPDLVSCVSTLIWASTRVDNIPELAEIRKQFKAKYGKKFDEAAMNNTGGVLNERVMAKLSVQPPSAYLVQTYLEKIAEEFEIDWKPKHPVGEDDMMNPMPAPDGRSVPMGAASGIGGTTVVTGTDVSDKYNSDKYNSGYGGGSYGGGSFGGGGGTYGGGGDGGASAAAASAAFPVAPGAYAMPAPAPTGKPGLGGGGGGSGTGASSGMADRGGIPPLAHAEPWDSMKNIHPVPPPHANDNEDEVDIYIPSAPGQGKKDSGGASVTSSITSSGANRNTGDNDEPRDDGNNGPSYDDLTARFAQLKR